MILNSHKSFHLFLLPKYPETFTYLLVSKKEFGAEWLFTILYQFQTISDCMAIIKIAIRFYKMANVWEDETLY